MVVVAVGFVCDGVQECLDKVPNQQEAIPGKPRRLRQALT